MDPKILDTFLPMLAEKSAEVIMPWYANNKMSVSAKADDSPVTQADRDAEEVLRTLIKKKFPDHGIIGEEFGNENEDAEYVWTLDPIDGTKSFITAVPLFGTLIGLLKNKKPLAGMMHQPVLKQLCIGNGESTTLNGSKVSCRKRTLADCTLLTSEFKNIAKFQKNSNWPALEQKTRLTRTWGDCYGYFLVASGWADIMADPVLEIWDIVPLIPIIQGAGGTISDWQGNEAVRKDGTLTRSAIASHPANHGEIIKILNS
jgi:histidinol phosphatase-like enzyme (inositol monophosphatase family)